MFEKIYIYKEETNLILLCKQLGFQSYNFSIENKIETYF